MTLHLASLREMRTALHAAGWGPTPAIDEEIFLLSAADSPFLSPSEVAEVRALLASKYAAPMVSERVASTPAAAALLAIDLVGAGAHETRAMSESEQAALDDDYESAMEWVASDDHDDGRSSWRSPFENAVEAAERRMVTAPDVDAILSRPRTPAERDAYDHEDPHAHIDWLNNAREQDLAEQHAREDEEEQRAVSVDEIDDVDRVWADDGVES